MRCTRTGDQCSSRDSGCGEHKDKTDDRKNNAEGAGNYNKQGMDKKQTKRKHKVEKGYGFVGSQRECGQG